MLLTLLSLDDVIYHEKIQINFIAFDNYSVFYFFITYDFVTQNLCCHSMLQKSLYLTRNIRIIFLLQDVKFFLKICRMSGGGERGFLIRTISGWKGGGEGSENQCFCRTSFLDEPLPQPWRISLSSKSSFLPLVLNNKKHGIQRHLHTIQKWALIKTRDSHFSLVSIMEFSIISSCFGKVKVFMIILAYQS